MHWLMDCLPLAPPGKSRRSKHTKNYFGDFPAQPVSITGHFWTLSDFLDLASFLVLKVFVSFAPHLKVSP